MPEQEPPKAENAEDKPKHINIHFKDQNGNEVTFKLKPITPLFKAIDAYCAQQGVTPDSLRFFFDNQRIVRDDTPASLEMEDGDLVDVHTYQQGGTADAAEPGAEKPRSLRLKVKHQVDPELEFKLKYTTPLKKLMIAYCKTKEIDFGSVRFLYEGERLDPEDTPTKQGMQDMDTIEAFLEQIGGDGDAAEAAQDEDQPVNEEKKSLEIVVKDQGGNEVNFKIKRTTQLGKVKAAYCQRNDKDPKAIRFTFDGTRIQDTDTPDSLDMEDKDVIDVFLEQLGGVKGL